ncbi:hypothetical protein QFZ76_007243 [Streptomyces sp. V4I2]|nr:hypothetical protein [Streptomyces sp. V4I2]
MTVWADIVLTSLPGGKVKGLLPEHGEKFQ